MTTCAWWPSCSPNSSPAATADHVQVGALSPAYPNRRNGGSRRYIEVYVLDDVAHVRAEPADSVGNLAALPAAQTRSIIEH
ncbi:hypothetical protein [Actinomadura sp. NPDC048394]|uniref:hypothetical protein n=1 Tax=Actinomadura sp. NPDC048394 TaxID=3158223 RepID=UPI00340BD8A2